MDEKSQDDQIDEIIFDLVGPRNALALDTLLGSAMPSLDVSKPNIHDSKKEFLEEHDAVLAVIDNLSKTFDVIVGEFKDADERKMFNRLHTVVDALALKPHHLESVDTASDLALRNIAQTGFHYNSLFLIKRMIFIYQERLRELEEQKIQFWTVSHRPPNYYARTIALRLARLYARDKNKKPTFGISQDGNFPSTDFGRALEKVFNVLEIKAAVRNAAEWAISELKEGDFVENRNFLAIPGFGASKSSVGNEATKEKIANMLRKSPDS